MKATPDYRRAVRNIKTALDLGIWPTVELVPDENPVCPWGYVLVVYHGPTRKVRRIPALYGGKVVFDAVFVESIEDGIEVLKELRSLLE